ncbi:MAG: phosphatidylserine decarboxylase family protein [Desulfovibrio sp.]|nr:phosphatidylserine decarboxylase family protein [Desulfovibrio sp.]
MITPNAGIAPEGKPFIFLMAFAALIFALIKLPCLACIALLLCVFCVQFFRDPERVVPGEAHVAVSPADGRILHVTARKDPFDGQERCCISIFMNVFNVHVNRVPVDCRVADIKYFPGTFVNASLDKASENNERCAWKLEESSGESWSMVQIAGLIARRIVCRAGRGDQLARGERCGIIRFGSRVDLYLPANYTATVHVGEHVFAGQSVLAKKCIG